MFRKIILLTTVLFAGFLVPSASASFSLPVGSLTLERWINPNNSNFNLRFIARNLSGTPGYADPTTLNNIFFLVDNSPRVLFNPGTTQGPDGKTYTGFDYAAGATYPLSPNLTVVISLNEDFFNFDDPFWSKIGFKTNETDLVVLEKPFTYGDHVLFYTSGPSRPFPPKTPNFPKAPKSPFLPKSPTVPTVPTAPVSPVFYLTSSEGGGVRQLPSTTNPEPATMILFGTGLAGAAIRKRFSV